MTCCLTAVARAIVAGEAQIKMNLVWRFYFGPDHRWRWQRLSTEGNVVEESRGSYLEYDGCLASAGERGYGFAPVVPAAGPRRSSGVKRTYARVQLRTRRLAARR